jgi:hypothetical protein
MPWLDNEINGFHAFLQELPYPYVWTMKMYSFFWAIPGFWMLYADVSEHPVCSIFFLLTPPMKMEQTVFRNVGM